MTPSLRWPTLVASVIAALSAGFRDSQSVLLEPMAADSGWSVAEHTRSRGDGRGPV